MFQKSYEQRRVCGSSSAALKQENIVKNNVKCIAFKVSVIQACVIFLINYTKSKYTFANLVKIVIRRTQRRASRPHDDQYL